MKYHLLVIGGGPAGMLGAATAGSLGMKVLLLEKNEKLGKKLYITGKGRCNITNAGDQQDYARHIITNYKFLYGALNNLSSHDLIDLINNLGVKTKVERGNRVFPVSDKSSDVISALQKHLKNSNVEVRLNTRVSRILSEEGCVTGVELAEGDKLRGDRVLLATGGMSYRQTGSNGEGYDIARQLGHTIIEPQPALVPLETEESWVKDLQGLTLKNVNVSVKTGKKVLAEQFGELLFTHFGVSGPAVLSLSSLIRGDVKYPLSLNIDLKPALDREQLNHRLQRDFKKHQGKYLKNSLNDLLPQKLIPLVLMQSGVEIHKQVDHITREERNSLVTALKSFALIITKKRPLNEAIITRGGINVKEVNPSTMESKLIKGLYFAGEILDVDALTGGYNLQIAFSTGYLCGLNIAKK